MEHTETGMTSMPVAGKNGNQEQGNSKIKICGLTRETDILCVNALKPEYIGFVFWEKSKRRVTLEQAQQLERKLDTDICPVGVFVREDREQVIRLLDRGIIHMAQLHGEEEPEYYEWLRSRTDKPLIQALTFKGDRGEERMQRLLLMAKQCRPDYYLLDSGMGSGKPFDWQLAESLLTQLRGELSKPFFLAGGLDCENVQDAVRQICPYVVDVSSGVETGGCKDPEKMRAFVRAVRESR